MKIILAKNALSGPLQVLAKVINNKSIYPILENFLFEIKGVSVRVVASDNETSMSTCLQTAEVEGEGQICIPARSFLEGIKDIPEQPISITIDDLEITVGYQNGEFKMIGQKAEEYPMTPNIEGEEFTISGKDLASGIGNTLFATANDELRPVLNGVYFDTRKDVVGDNLVFVGTDGQRLITCQKKIDTNGVQSFILPKKPSALVRSFAEDEKDIKIKTDGKNALFAGGMYELTCRLIDGFYPKWEGVVRKDSKFRMDVDRNALINALKRVSVFASSSGMVRFDVSENSLKVQGENPDFSVSAKEELSCQCNGNISIGFKASYLIEMLSNLSCEMVGIGMEEPSLAGVLGDGCTMGILMPMILQ